MHHISPYELKNSGEGAQTPPHWGGDTPSPIPILGDFGASTLTPSALGPLTSVIRSLSTGYAVVILFVCLSVTKKKILSAS